MSNREAEFYIRQTSLADIGSEGQAALKASRVLVIGVGGLGCAAASYLASAGVGRLTLCDGDTVDYSNLHRQPLYSPEDENKQKAIVAAAKLRLQNPWVTVEAITQHASIKTIEALLTRHDIVLDCTDNLASNALIHDACYLHKTPLIAAAIHTFEGILHRYQFDQTQQVCGRCLQAVWKQPDGIGNCAERGVMSALPGVFGTMQAQVALHHLLKLETLSHGTSFTMDMRNMQTQLLAWDANPACPLCMQTPTPDLSSFHDDESELWVMSVDAIADAIIIDIRETEERSVQPAPKQFSNLAHPLSVWQNSFLDNTSPTILFCATGKRSLNLVKQLRQQGFGNVYSLHGGIKNLAD